jgi:hypothetical protein
MADCDRFLTGYNPLSTLTLRLIRPEEASVDSGFETPKPRT